MNVSECRKLSSVEIRYRTFLTLVRDETLLLHMRNKFTSRWEHTNYRGIVETSLSLCLSLSLSLSLSYSDRDQSNIRRKRLEIGRNGEYTEI